MFNGRKFWDMKQMARLARFVAHFIYVQTSSVSFLFNTHICFFFSVFNAAC